MAVEVPEPQDSSEEIERVPEAPVAAVPTDDGAEATQDQILSNTQVSESGMGVARLGMT